MKYAEAGGDVRGTSANAAYMGVVFEGTMDEAIEQARSAPDHGIPTLNGRAELLSFLRVPSQPFSVLGAVFNYQRKLDDINTEVERLALEAHIEKRAAAPKQPWDGLSPWSYEYALARWPQNFKVTP